jgi:hypothetical protein
VGLMGLTWLVGGGGECRKALALHQMKAEMEVGAGDDDDEKDLQGVRERLDVLDVCMTSLVLFDELRPFKLLSFDTSRALFVSLATAFVSFFSSLLLVLVKGAQYLG